MLNCHITPFRAIARFKTKKSRVEHSSQFLAYQCLRVVCGVLSQIAPLTEFYMPRSLFFDPKEVLKHCTNNRLEATSLKDSHFWGEVVPEIATEHAGQFQTKKKMNDSPSEKHQGC